MFQIMYPQGYCHNSMMRGCYTLWHIFQTKHTAAECNCNINDKERLAIIKALVQWRPECEGAAYSLEQKANQKNIGYFMTTNLLNWRQARWSEYWTQLYYGVVYRRRKSNGTADAFTRRPGDLPLSGDEWLKSMEQVVLNQQSLPEQLDILANGLPKQDYLSISDHFDQAYQVDLVSQKILNMIWGNDTMQEITVAEWPE